MTKRIGIIGCGWLGEPLAKTLRKAGWHVSGSTTRSAKLRELNNAGITAFKIQIQETGIQGDINSFLEGLDVLVLNIPPGLRRNPQSNYVQKIMGLLKALAEHSQIKLLYVSSTSVFGKSQGEVSEKDTPKPDTPAGKQLREAEKIIQVALENRVSIVRFGGLIGPERHPVRMLSGRTALKGGDMAINLIHRDDCIRILQHILEEDLWGLTVHGVYPEHPTKAAYYKAEAKKRGIPHPKYLKSDTTEQPKIIKSEHSFGKKKNFLTSIYS